MSEHEATVEQIGMERHVQRIQEYACRVNGVTPESPYHTVHMGQAAARLACELTVQFMTRFPAGSLEYLGRDELEKWHDEFTHTEGEQ